MLISSDRSQQYSLVQILTKNFTEAAKTDKDLAKSILASGHGREARFMVEDILRLLFANPLA